MSYVATSSTRTVGVREFRAKLSDYVGAVKAGRSFVLTERGKVVARLVPPVGESSFDQLIAAGLIEPPKTHATTLPIPLPATATISDLVAEQRR